MMKIFRKSIKKEIDEISKDILNEEWFSKITKANIDSAGISDGKQIISDYLKNDEMGCAFEHLTYIISESDIKLSAEQQSRLNHITNKLNF